MPGIESLIPGFADAVAYFERSSNAFNNAYQRFLSVQYQAAAANDPEYSNLKRMAALASQTAEGVRRGLDMVKSWLDSAGLNGMDMIEQLPALASVGTVTAAATALTYLTPRLEVITARYSPQGAGSSAQQLSGLSNITGLTTWIMIGAAIYFLAPVLLKKK